MRSDNPSITKVVLSASTVFNIRQEDITGQRRFVEFVNPRFAAINVAYRCCGKSLNQIGSIFQRDHTSILNAVRRAQEMSACDPTYAFQLQMVEEIARRPDMESQA
jgi:chromosomal replication initiation ATPase DnaA